MKKHLMVLPMAVMLFATKEFFKQEFARVPTVEC